jgi:uncharacterized protein
LILKTTRYQSLDILRGVAVMGILLMNIISFALPKAAYLNPLVYGGETVADRISWAVSFVLIDTKMRGLFSMLFGASMLLVYERAEAQLGQGAKVHVRRMLWLLAFGLIHFFLIWNGDILVLYAACGLVGMILLLLDERSLAKATIALLIIGLVPLTASALSMHWLEHVARLPSAAPETLTDYRALISSLMPKGSNVIAREISLYTSGFLDIFSDRLANETGSLVLLLLTFGPETLGLMGLGMLLFRNGFLAGEWTSRAYFKAALYGYSLGFLGLGALLWLCIGRGYDPVTVVTISIAWAIPFHFCVMIGHAALILLIIKLAPRAVVFPWIAATGRMAFSNYLGTSLLMTTLFYGYGFGLFGQLSRAHVYLVVPPMWILMLAWSKPWLATFHYGPLEWLWRSLARGERQAFRHR